MVKVSVEVRKGAARYRVTVQTTSIRRALELTKKLYPDNDGRVIFPIDPDTFFVDDVGPVEQERAVA